MTPLSTTLQFNVRKVSKMATIIFNEPYTYFLNLGLYVNDLLENCTIFGTTIFLDRRENAAIGENGFLRLFCHFLCLIQDFFKH